MEKYLGRNIKQEIAFKKDGTFQSLYAAEAWCAENSYESGSLCRDLPVALQLDRYDLPQKWKDFDNEDKKLIDGVMISADFREGEVKILILE